MRDLPRTVADAAIEGRGIRRRQLCERIGIARRSADAYALGRAPVPRTVELAIRAVEAGPDRDPGERSPAPRKPDLPG